MNFDTKGSGESPPRVRVTQRLLGGKGMSRKISGERPSLQRRELVLRPEAGQDQGEGAAGEQSGEAGAARAGGPLGGWALSWSEGPGEFRAWE